MTSALPDEVVFTYTLLERVSLAQPDPDRHLERWVVSVSIGGADHDERGVTIADAHVIIINLEAGRDVRDFADAVTGEWREVAETIVAGTEAPDAGSPVIRHVLVLERVWVQPEYRGNGLGPIIAAVAIDRLGRGCRLAACYPAPFEGDRRPEDRDRAVEALGQIWEKAGFRPWSDGVWMIDLEEPLARDALAALLPAPTP